MKDCGRLPWQPGKPYEREIVLEKRDDSIDGLLLSIARRLTRAHGPSPFFFFFFFFFFIQPTKVDVLRQNDQ